MPRLLLLKEQLKVCLYYSFSSFSMDFRELAWPEIDLCPYVSLSLSLRSPEPVAILPEPNPGNKISAKLPEIRLDFIMRRKKER